MAQFPEFDASNTDNAIAAAERALKTYRNKTACVRAGYLRRASKETFGPVAAFFP